MLDSLIGDDFLEHFDMLFQDYLGPLQVVVLALHPCNLLLHFGSFNVPRISCTFMVVPFDLEEAHHT